LQASFHQFQHNYRPTGLSQGENIAETGLLASVGGPLANTHKT